MLFPFLAAYIVGHATLFSTSLYSKSKPPSWICCKCSVLGIWGFLFIRFRFLLRLLLMFFRCRVVWQILQGNGSNVTVIFSWLFVVTIGDTICIFNNVGLYRQSLRNYVKAWAISLVSFAFMNHHEAEMGQSHFNVPKWAFSFETSLLWLLSPSPPSRLWLFISFSYSDGSFIMSLCTD